MATWNGKSQSGLLGYKIFVFILRRGGLYTAYFLLVFVALYFFLFSKSNRHIFAYLRTKIGLGFFEAIVVLYKNYFLFGQTLIDRVAAISGLSTKFTYDFDGEEYLHQIVKGNKGGILISAHMGNWEIAGHLLYRVKVKIHVVMHAAEHEKIKNYLDKVKGSTLNVIVLKDDFTHIYQISEALSRGEIICMHGDRFMPWSKTFTSSFLGSNALFPQGPFALALSMKVPVCYVFGMKLGLTHYKFSSTIPKVYTSDRNTSKEALLSGALLDFTTEMEKKIRKYPAQWFNYYDFWA